MVCNFTLEQIISLIGGKRELENNSLSCIKGIASLEKATSHDIAFIFDRGDASVFLPLTLEKIHQSNAGLFVATKAVIPGKNYLIVDDALAAFNNLVTHIRHQETIEHQALEFIQPDNVFIGKNTVIESSAIIGNNTSIGALCYVGKQCKIGANVILHPGVIVLDRCSIGDYSIIHAGTVIGSDGFGYEVNTAGLRKIPQIGVVKIGKHVEIGANCSIDRATFDATIISDGVKIDNNVHIAHNVIIGYSSVILAQTAVAGSARIGNGCQIGGHVAIKDNVIIGDGVKIVSKSGVLSNVTSSQTVAGIPAMPFNEWKRLTVIFKKLPSMIQQFQQLSRPSSSWFSRLFKK